MNNQQHKQIAIMWLTRQGFSLLVTGQSSLLTSAFTEDAVKYFDIINEAKFQSEIIQFITEHNLTNLRIFIVAAPDTLIESLVPSPVDRATNEKQFLDLVPYENVYSKLFDEEKNVRFVAMNADIYVNLKNAFEQKNNDVESVIPYFATGQNIFSLSLAQSLSSKLDLFSKNNIVNIPTFQESNPALPNQNSQDQKPKSSLPLLLGVFGVLLLVLVVVIITQLKPAQPPKPSQTSKKVCTTNRPDNFHFPDTYSTGFSFITTRISSAIVLSSSVIIG